MDNQFEIFINTYKNVLQKKNNREIRKILFFALQSIKSHDITKFKPKQQKIINQLKNYYGNPSRIKENELNDTIMQYYIDQDDEIDEDDENQGIDVELDEEDKEVGVEQYIKFDEKKWKLRYAIEDVIQLEKYSIEKLLSVYNITLEPYLDDEISRWLCEDQLEFSKPYKRVFIKQYIKKHGIIKCNTVVQVIMVSVYDKNKKIYPIFQTKYTIIRNAEDVDYFLRQSELDIKSRIGMFTKKYNDKYKNSTDTVQINPSGFTDFGIEYENLNIIKIKNAFASAYIELPIRIIHTKSCINIKNNDDKCFLYCHMLHERYRKNGFKKIQNPERLHGEKAYNYNNEMIHLNYENIHFPISFNTFYTIKKIEEQNQIRINVFEYKENKKNDIVPIYHSKKEYKNCMNLLVICDKTKKKYHYVYIKNLNGLLRSNFKRVVNKICQDCFKQFSTQKAFNSINHKCIYKHDANKLPSYMAIVDNKLVQCPIDMYVKEFNKKHTIFLPFIMYCDFESILKKTNDEKYPDKRQHELSSYCYNLVCRERPIFNRFKLYRGCANESVIDHFLNEVKTNILEHIKQCKKKFYALPVLTDEELKRHKKMKKCEFCNVKFNNEIK